MTALDLHAEESLANASAALPALPSVPLSGVLAHNGDRFIGALERADSVAARLLSDAAERDRANRTPRIEVELLREHDRLLRDIAATLRTRPEGAPEAVREREAERKRLEQEHRGGGVGTAGAGLDLDELARQAQEVAGTAVLTAVLEVPDAKALLETLDRVRGKLPGAAIVLGAAVDGRVHLVAGVAPALVQRGVKAGVVVKAAAEVTGGGGGGRDTVAQAGGRHPEKLQEALLAARVAIEAALTG